MSEMRPLGAAGLSTKEEFAADGPIWSRCRELAVPRLTQAVAMALSYVIDDLTEQARQPRDLAHFRQVGEAKDVLRHARDGIVASFQRRYGEFSLAGLPAAAASTAQASGFSLMTDSDYHDTASHDVIAQTLRSSCDRELRLIERRYRGSTPDEKRDSPVNPLDPDLIGQAVLMAIKERDLSLAMRGMLAPMIATHLSISVRTFYQDMLEFLAGGGVLAEAAPTKPPAAQAVAAKAPPPVVAAGPVPALDRDAFKAQLKERLQHTRLPKSVLVFLYDHWEAAYLAVNTPLPPAGLALADPDATLDTLVRTLNPINWRDARAELLPLLPSLLKRLQQGLQAAGVQAETRDAFLVGLARCHAAVMKAAKELEGSAPGTA
jgi:hypothetical protein